MTEEQLSALLRVKRHEQPPPGYFDTLLVNVHRRQRMDLLQKPLWQIAFERVQTYFGEHSMSPMSYAGAMAGVVLVGTLSIIGFSGGHSGGAPGGAVAKTEVANPSAVASTTERLASAADATRLTAAQQAATTTARTSQYVPRYVIDARPASYEPSFSF